MDISVVIPTIGDRNLKNTIDSINSSDIKISEIIICTIKKSELTINESKNVKVIYCKKRGQVNQRIEGFKKAKGKFVLQLDDDIILNKSCIRLLKNALKKNQNLAISPNIFEIHKNKSIYDYRLGIKNKITNIILGEKFNNKIGKITSSGFETYPLITNNSKGLVKTEWLLGGCVMHLRKNLILRNYFPFEGKAYCEDLFHSFELRKRNIDLYINPQATAFLELNSKKTNLYDFIKELKKDLLIRKQLVKKYNLNIVKMYLVYIIKCINYVK